MPMERTGIQALVKGTMDTQVLDGQSSVDYMLIHGDAVDGVWHLCAEALYNAVDPIEGSEGLQFVYESIKAFQAQLWLFHTGPEIHVAVVTRISYTASRTRVCTIYMASGGSLELWMDYCITVVEKWAKEQGCDYLQIVGRKGWARKTQHRGFMENSRLLRKRIALVN